MLESIISTLKAYRDRFFPYDAASIRKYHTIWDALFAVQNGTGFHCTRVMQTHEQALAVIAHCKVKGGMDRAQHRATRDHIIPMSEQIRKGWHIPLYENCILSCGRCNNKRSSDQLSPERMTEARAVNTAALHAFRTQMVRTKEDQLCGVMGRYERRKEQEREYRPFKWYPTSQWEYLFRESTRACLLGSATNQLDQRRGIDKGGGGGAVQTEAG